MVILVLINILILVMFVIVRFILFNKIMNNIEKIPGYTMYLERECIFAKYYDKKIKLFFLKIVFNYAKYIEDNYVWGGKK